MKQRIIERIRQAGVVGAGGAGLPTHIKADADVDTVLVNGASCEPLLMSDPYLMETEIDAVIEGLTTLMDCTGASRGVICLKGKHGKAMESARNAAARHERAGIEVFELGDFYPAGDEHVLVHEALGRTVPERGLPLQVGAVVSNVETLYNVAAAMREQPVTHRYLTVGGEVHTPGVVKAPVGASVADVLELAGGVLIKDYVVVDGGPMMGRVLPDIHQPVTKTTSGLLVLPPDHPVVARKIMAPERVRRITESICCQCSQCTDLCPRNLLGHRLHPHRLMRIPAAQIVDSPLAREALLCSECGACEKFACPMLLSPREVNAQIKRTLMEANVRWEGTPRVLEAHPFRSSRAIPTKRLVQRLGLAPYDVHPGFIGELTPKTVSLPLRQHIGAPSVCLVSPGDRVRCGDVVGELPEKGMSARVHASIDGVVESVRDGMVTIKAE